MHGRRVEEHVCAKHLAASTVALIPACLPMLGGNEANVEQLCVGTGRKHYEAITGA